MATQENNSKANGTADNRHGHHAQMSVDEKLWWLERNLQEVLGRDLLRQRLQEAASSDGNGKALSLYWGTGI